MKPFTQRKIAQAFLTVAAAIAVALFVSEISIRFLCFTPQERAGGAAALWSTYDSEYSHRANPSDDCSYFEALGPHPFLGVAYHRQPPCGNTQSNNVGVTDLQDFPQARDPNFFTVALLGGSVAAQLAAGNYRGQVWLEDALNRKYVSPNGKPFRVRSGALGGWGYPNQLTFLFLHGHAVDAAVAIDGYNEAYRIGSGFPLYRFDPVMFLAVARPAGAELTPLLAGLPSRLRRLGLRNPLFRNSFLAFYAFRTSFLSLGADRGKAEREQRELVDRFLTFPAGWDDQRKESWNRDRFETYLRLLRATSDSIGIRYAHFVQPIRLLEKNLTPEEKQYHAQVDPALYRRVVAAASGRLAREGVLTRSLVSVFQNEQGAIYSDDIHCRYGETGSNPGYVKLSEAMADSLAEMWKLKRK